jgi:hypothetical protein
MSSSLKPHNVCGQPAKLEEVTWFRLVECHGLERARSIALGQDRATNADLAKWRNLGRVVIQPGARSPLPAAVLAKIQALADEGLCSGRIANRFGGSHGVTKRAVERVLAGGVA